MAVVNRRAARLRAREVYCSTAVPQAKLLYDFAKRMRQQPTLAEYMLWGELRATRLGVRFRAQHVIGPYIVDFACLSEGLVVEVDGSVHDYPEAIAYDQHRTSDLEHYGFRVLRFRNEEVYEDVDAVAARIAEVLTDLRE